MTEEQISELKALVSKLEERVAKLESTPAPSSSSWNSFVAAVAPYVPGWRIWIAGLVGAAASTGTHLTVLKPAAAPAPLMQKAVE